MKNNVKVIIAAVFIVGLIGLKVYFQAPHWRTGTAGSQNLPLGQMFVQSFSLKKHSKLRITATEKDKRLLMVYWLTQPDSIALQNRSGDLLKIKERADKQMLCLQGEIRIPIEFELPSGDYCIHVETVPAKEDTSTAPYQISYKIEEYR